MNAQSQKSNPTPSDNGEENRNATRRRLFTAHFAVYPGYVMGNRGRVSAHSKMGGFVPRSERRNLARAFAAGEWNKRHVLAMAASASV